MIKPNTPMISNTGGSKYTVSDSARGIQPLIVCRRLFLHLVLVENALAQGFHPVKALAGPPSGRTALLAE